ncbi:MAG: GNAT family N-acetyltransferase [Bacilli bacterium]|nr:GNAT family N-acetyltransferase [Bacilli bacterium]
MNKIEINDINELIRKQYPKALIEKLLNDVLVLSLKVKEDYPDYKEWYQTKQIPGIYDNTRNIIIAHIGNRLVGFISLKKTETEKKICTFYVEKTFQKNKIGTILVEKAVTYLEEEKPLITIPMNKMKEFKRISNRYDWKITDIKENLYRTGTPEVIVNGELKDTASYQELEKTYQKIYHIYKFKTLSNLIKVFLNKYGLEK